MTAVPRPPRIAPLRDVGPSPDGERIRRVFVRDLTLDARVGVFAHEKERAQRIRFNIDMGVDEGDQAPEDRLSAVVCYDDIVRRVRAVIADGHVHLIETLAERVAAICLQDERVRWTRVRIEKLEVYGDAQSVGIEIERVRRD